MSGSALFSALISQQIAVQNHFLLWRTPRRRWRDARSLPTYGVYTIDEMDENGREAKSKRETVTPLSTNGGKPPLPPVVSKGTDKEESEPEEAV